MTDLILEHLKRIQSDLSEVKRDMRDLRTDVIFLRSMFGDFIKADAHREGDYVKLMERVQRIERHLDINDTI